MIQDNHTGNMSIVIKILTILSPFALVIGMFYAAIALKDLSNNLLLTSVIAILIGLFGVAALFFSLNAVVNLLPEVPRRKFIPLVFVGPATLLILFYKVLPALRTIQLSFYNDNSSEFVGVRNFEFIVTDSIMKQAIQNNVYWLVGVTFFSVVFGIIIATLADRVRFESAFKSLIFLPMAISFVGASVIWRFVYAFTAPNRPQIGVLNAILVELGSQPIGWLIERPINNAALIIILIWLQTGFATVIISSAIKNVPSELLDAARVDGANELMVFFRIILPSIRPTIATVATTILILTLKVFDIVWVMTSGNFGTEVVASRMMKEIFTFRNFGRGSAIAVVLMLATIPFMIYNVRRMAREEA